MNRIHHIKFQTCYVMPWHAANAARNMCIDFMALSKVAFYCVSPSKKDKIKIILFTTTANRAS